MKKIVAAIDWVSIWTGKIVSFSTILVAVAVVYEIVMRTIFLKPTLWAAEGTVFACGIMYALGGAWTMIEDRHVRIDILYSRLSPRGKVLLDLLTYFFFLTYMVAMAWASTKYAFESLGLRETTGTAWNPPVYPVKLVLMSAFYLLIFQGTAGFLRNLAKLAGWREL